MVETTIYYELALEYMCAEVLYFKISLVLIKGNNLKTLNIYALKCSILQYKLALKYTLTCSNFNITTGLTRDV
jgi:hypothetical protein